jgi:hypothetical protein
VVRWRWALNPFVSGPAVGPGSHLVGLCEHGRRARRARDITRGGGAFVCGELLGVTPVAANSLELAAAAEPANGRIALDVTLGRSEWVELPCSTRAAGARTVQAVYCRG